MTCHSSENIDNNRRSDTEGRAVDADQSRVASAMRDLKNTGWYWGRLTAGEAKEILQHSAEGTFLVRDSSQRDYLFTISAMTSAGPTNLRIEYRDGKFKLDSVVLLKPKLKQFDSVVHLVEHYVKLSQNSSSGSGSGTSGSGSSSGSGGTTGQGSGSGLGPAPPLGPNANGTVQLLLTKPAYTSMPSLQHLCRIAINKSTRRVTELPLPNRLKDYLTEYTYHV
ncbi:suppressor of cytokine signaling 2 [Engraulis encrasicolus]|uniref:suppressor of cytokine signaling 2 n=1 Tax=Engraulis encrasicolus TaxID=184585 RepID=UPI002FD37E94